MASIPGSQFDVTARATSVNIVETSGGALPPPVPGSFNLEVWTGPLATAPALGAGYQAEAVLAGSGGPTTTLTLLSGTLDTTISTGGTEFVSSGAVASGATVGS